MELANLGYRIIAPNYPMSFGLGKSYQNQNIDDAILDMLNWKEYLSTNTNELYLLSRSSGNIIMEGLMRYELRDVSSAVSLFGLKSNWNSSLFHEVPFLKIMGKNDPYVQFGDEKNTNLNNTFTFLDEGHWLRKISNQKATVKKIDAWFQK